MNAIIENQRHSPGQQNGSAAQRRPAAVPSLIEVLRQLTEVIESVTNEQYAQKPVGVVPSSIGGHVRHCLDHIDALLAGARLGAVDYDQRRRGTDVETSRQAALDAMRRQERHLLAFPDLSEYHPLEVTITVASTQPPVTVATSVGRELAFVLSHTIHHNALIAVMGRMLALPVPEHFGYAPSTLAHQEKAPCVR